MGRVTSNTAERFKFGTKSKKFMAKWEVNMNKYSGSNFDDFLAEEGILEEVSESAQKRLLALQIEEDIVNATNQSKNEN